MTDRHPWTGRSRDGTMKGMRPSRLKRFSIGFMIGCIPSLCLFAANWLASQGVMIDALYYPSAFFVWVPVVLTLPFTAIPPIGRFIAESPLAPPLAFVYLLGFWPMLCGVLGLFFDPRLASFRLRTARS